MDIPQDINLSHNFQRNLPMPQLLSIRSLFKISLNIKLIKNLVKLDNSSRLLTIIYISNLWQCSPIIWWLLVHLIVPQKIMLSLTYQVHASLFPWIKYQIQHMIGLLTRASKHVCSNANANVFLSLHYISNSAMTLPNNIRIPISLYGDIKINSQ